MALEKTVTVKDARGKDVQISQSDEGVKFVFLGWKRAPIPRADLIAALEELRVPPPEPRRPTPQPPA
jgi:hypothetical protein